MHGNHPQTREHLRPGDTARADIILQHRSLRSLRQTSRPAPTGRAPILPMDPFIYTHIHTHV
jgi:hypothetical protein